MDPIASESGPLRQRLEEIARRRLPEDAVESVLESALARLAVLEGEPAVPGPPLLRCLRLLREEICAHYAAHPPVTRFSEWTREQAPVVVEAIDADALRRVSEAALEELAEESPAACVYFRQLSQGATPREVASRVQGGLGALRQRLHRARGLLDRCLVARGART